MDRPALPSAFVHQSTNEEPDLCIQTLTCWGKDFVVCKKPVSPTVPSKLREGRYLPGQWILAAWENLREAIPYSGTQNEFQPYPFLRGRS